MPMKPAEKHGNVWRKRGRAAERRVRTGRRSAHPGVSYARQSRIRDWTAPVSPADEVTA